MLTWFLDKGESPQQLDKDHHSGKCSWAWFEAIVNSYFGKVNGSWAPKRFELPQYDDDEQREYYQEDRHKDDDFGVLFH